MNFFFIKRAHSEVPAVTEISRQLTCLGDRRFKIPAMNSEQDIGMNNVIDITGSP